MKKVGMILALILFIGCTKIPKYVLYSDYVKDYGKFQRVDTPKFPYKVYVDVLAIPEDVKLVITYESSDVSWGIIVDSTDSIWGKFSDDRPYLIVIDIKDCVDYDISPTRVFSHELTHYKQLKRCSGWLLFKMYYNLNRHAMEVEAHEGEFLHPPLILIEEK